MHFFFSSKKFKESLSTAVFTTFHVMKEGSPIVLISHELDGDWQFMGNELIEDYTKVAMVVSLEEVIKSDKSILRIADLQIGYCATRKTKSDKWIVSKIDYSADEMKQFGYFCSKCGVYHKQIPMAYGADAPYQYFLIPETEREERCDLTDDQCIIDNKFYFMRGGIQLIVEDNPDNFCWNVWVLIDKKDFERMNELWKDENRILEKPYAGKLATQLDLYPDTLDLPVYVISQKVGLIPMVELTECNHPLYLEQENSINMDRVISFAKKLLYNH
jgi:hypothetical protein